MPDCQVDPSLKPVEMEGLKFPLGVYPVEQMTPRRGYSCVFEPADADEAGEWEEWPDRYAFDIVIGADRLGSLCTQLFALLPGRIYPIFDVMGHDAYREIDPYISYELIGFDRFLDGCRRYRPFLYEDGLVGFGAMSDDPFCYVFLDEHKIVTARVQADMRERVEKLLRAFDLEPVEEPAGSDAAAHEHRSVLLTPDDQPELLSGDEITERLRDEWRLTLNVDPEENIDDDGEALGLTAWRCLVRCLPEDAKETRYAEVLLFAPNLRDAEDLAQQATLELSERNGAPGSDVSTLMPGDLFVVAADRVLPDQMRTSLKDAGADSNQGEQVGAKAIRWLS